MKKPKKKQKRFTKVWTGETGKYRCVVVDEIDDEMVAVKRDIWLFKDDTYSDDILEIGDLIPGTTKDCWSKPNEWSDESVAELYAAVCKQAVKDVNRASRYISKFPKKHKRLHFKYRPGDETPEAIQDADTAEWWIEGTKYGDIAKKALEEQGDGYELRALLESWYRDRNEAVSKVRSKVRARRKTNPHNTDADRYAGKPDTENRQAV